MTKYRLAAFSGGTLVNLLGETNFWDWVRKRWGIPNLRLLYKEGKITRQQLMEEYGYWREKGLTRATLESALEEDLKLVSGCRETFDKLKVAGTATAIISGSSDILVNKIASLLGPKYTACNEIIFDNSGLPVSTKPTHSSPDIRLDKIAALKDFAGKEGISIKQCAVIVHQQEDAALCAVAGFSVAFNPLDEIIQDAASAVVKSEDLVGVLQHLL